MFEDLMGFASEYVDECANFKPGVNKNLKKKVFNDLEALRLEVDAVNSAIETLSGFIANNSGNPTVEECLTQYENLLFAYEDLFDKAAIFSRIGLCYKQLGDYDTALRFLSDANLINSEKASILAEMADCYALCGEEKTSKVLFREAFFINPQDIDISLLESNLFCKLYDEIAKSRKDKAIIAEWFPVEGVLLGVLNVKRELRALEVGKLKQSIYALETELKNEGVEPLITIPRLINNYFWLIDHYTTIREDRSKITEILLKIKLLNADVYERYTV